MHCLTLSEALRTEQEYQPQGPKEANRLSGSAEESENQAEAFKLRGFGSF